MATATEIGVVIGAAFVGMVNGMGRDRGVDQAILPTTAGDTAITAPT